LLLYSVYAFYQFLSNLYLFFGLLEKSPFGDEKPVASLCMVVFSLLTLSLPLINIVQTLLMRKFFVLLYFVLLLIISFLLLECHPFRQKETDASTFEKLTKYRDKVRSFDPDNMDSVVRYADSALHFINSFAVADSVKTSWLQIKADALSALGLLDSANNTFLQARDQSLISKNTAVQAYADLFLAQALIDQGNYFMAGKYVTEGLELYENLDDEYQIARAHNLYGALLTFQGNYHEAQEHLIKASAIFEKLSMFKALGSVFNNIATNYQAINDNDKAIDYFNRSIELSLKNHDTLNYVSTLNNLGIYYHQIVPDSAEFYFKEALKWQNNQVIEYEIISVKFNLANLYFDSKDFDKAMPVYRQMTEICMAYGIYSGLARTYNGIANIYEAQNDDAKAIHYYQKAYRLADSIGEIPVAMVFLSNIQYMNEKQGKFEQALACFKKIKETNDSLLSLEKQIAVHDLEMLYNKEKTERENEALNSNNLLQKSSIRSKNIIIGFVLLILAGLGVLLWNIYSLYKQRDEAYNTLIRKYREELILQAQTKAAESVIPSINHTPTNDAENQLFELMNYFETEKPFLNSKLKIEDVAKGSKMSRKSIELVLKKTQQISFNTFVNNYRIAEAKRMLTDDKYNNLKIEAIAKEAGFGSKVNFYAAFRQITGTKPSLFRDTKPE